MDVSSVTPIAGLLDRACERAVVYGQLSRLYALGFYGSPLEVSRD